MSGDIGYCQFVFEFTKSAEPARMANLSIDAAEAAIKACVMPMDADANYLLVHRLEELGTTYAFAVSRNCRTRCSNTSWEMLTTSIPSINVK